MADTSKDKAAIVDQPTTQNVPLGGQPVHPIVTPEHAIASQEADTPIVAVAFKSIIDALQKAKEMIDPNSRTAAAMTLRNFTSVWIDHAQDELSRL